MSIKNMYPLLIIIFSILVIVAILQNRNNKRLNNSLEKFMNNYLSKQENNLKTNIQNNLNITREIANGDWTFWTTTADSNYNVSNLMSININNIPDISTTNNNYGSINIKIDEQNTINFIITFITNEVIIANFHDYLTLNIKFLNQYSNNENNININPIYQIPNTPTCIVSLIVGNGLYVKFASYKVVDSKVSGEVYRIIKAGYYLIDSPPPYYDFVSYAKIIGNYKFSDNLISMNYGVNNNSIMQKIMNSYGSKIKFTIRRVFYSPSEDNKEIITKNSTPVLLNVISNNNIPTNIVIAPFSNDKRANALNTFFKPKATILYFYKLTNYASDYNYSNPNLIIEPTSILNLQNNANKYFPSNIKYNDLNSIQRINTSTYTMTFVTRINSNMDDPTIIPFNTLFNLL